MSEAFEHDEYPEPSGSDDRIPTPLEAYVYPDDCAGWTVSVTPGSATAKVLAQLDPGRLSQAGRVDALVGLERLKAWAAALQTRMMIALVDDPCTGSVAPKLDRDWAKEDVRACLGESAIGANARIRTATELMHRLPATLAALETGRITARHAQAVVDTTQVLDDEPARQIEQAVLPASSQIGDPVPTMTAFRTRLRRARLKSDPRTAEEQAARAAEDRDVWVMPGEDEMSYLGAPLPAEGAATVLAAVNAKSDQIQAPDDLRTKAQRRADGLVQICADYLSHGAPAGCKIKNDTGNERSTDDGVWTRAGARAPRYHGLKPQIQVSVALSTLLGRDEQPGELDGYGPISADVARRIAADPTGTWRRLVTDEIGQLVDYGRTTYKPPADLAKYVIARDKTCRAPGCNRSAARSDLHHIVAFSRGGTTDGDNLIALCERHHYAIHDAGWTVTHGADGVTTWTSPTGHVFRTRPDSYPIDTTCKIKNDTTEPADQSVEADARPVEDEPPF